MKKYKITPNVFGKFFMRSIHFVYEVTILFLSATFSTTNSTLVNESVALNALVKIDPSSSKYLQKIDLEVDEREHTGFLIVVTNRLEFHRESCSLFDDLFSVGINQRRFSFACSHYAVLYEESPTTIKVVPSLFHVINASLAITVTAVRVSCPPFHNKFRACPNQPLICISRQLFCDGIDNCGVNADEADCIVDYPPSILLSIIDERRTALQILALCAPLALGGLVICFCFVSALNRWCDCCADSVSPFSASLARGGRYSRKYGKRVQWRGGAGGILSAGLFPAAVKWRNRRRFLRSDSLEAEETVALLTLGLKSVIPHLAKGPNETTASNSAPTSFSVYKNVYNNSNAKSL